jgi:hypothetical protein
MGDGTMKDIDINGEQWGEMTESERRAVADAILRRELAEEEERRNFELRIRLERSRGQ